MPRGMPVLRRRSVLMLLALLLLPLLLAQPAEFTASAPATSAPLHAAPPPAPTLPPCVRPGLPEGVPTQRIAVPLRRLMKGLVLVVDEAHPLPDGYPGVDAVSVQVHSRGEVTCRDASAVLAVEALDALEALYAAAQADRVIQLTVFSGARSREQQRSLMTETFALLCRELPAEAALAQARGAVASPDCSEHQTGYAVDVRVCPVWNGWPEEGPLEQSTAGRWLCEHAWRFGFIRRWPEAEPDGLSCRAYHFRYVGRAHAAIMHALGCTLEEYLQLLHTTGALTLYNENNVPAASAVCTVLGERSAAFRLPAGSTTEDLSMDNLGYAVASCLYE